MKRGCLVFACLIFITIFSYEAYAVNNVGKVLKVNQEVYIVRNNQKISAKPLMPIFLEDEVETGRNSRAKLQFKDDSILNLGEKSRVVIKEYRSGLGNGSKSIYRIIDGYLKVIVGKSDLKVHSPTAVGGGFDNTASGYYSSVSGGYKRIAPTSYDWTAGRFYFSEH